MGALPMGSNKIAFQRCESQGNARCLFVPAKVFAPQSNGIVSAHTENQLAATVGVINTDGGKK